MHFIEEIFHVAPDGGSGRLELAIVLMFLALTLTFFVVMRRRARRRRNSPEDIARVSCKTATETNAFSNSETRFSDPVGLPGRDRLAASCSSDLG
jgi:hypothetical protein